MAESGNGHKKSLIFKHPPQRVVSMVPSMTESLFDLGLGESLVGITDYCTQPAGKVERLTRIGGTKNPSSDRIAALKPDLIIANQEENTPEIVDELEQRGLQVWVTFPKTLRQSVDVLWTLVGVFKSKSAAIRLDTLERALEWAEAESTSRKPWRYFCPIWKSETSAKVNDRSWWMTFNWDTYTHDLLRLFGGQNIFSARERRYPLEADLGLTEAQNAPGRDTRYPRVTQQEIINGNPEVILLPNEPYSFDEDQRQAIFALFGETLAVQSNNVLLIDGSLLTWHGTRLGKALTELSGKLNF